MVVILEFIKNTKFVKDLPMIDAQFRFNQCNIFREEHISVFSSYGPVLKLWPVVAAILDFRSAYKTEDLPMIIPGQFGYNYPSGFREEAFWNIFPIGSNVKLSPAVAAILNFIPEQKT